MNIDIIQSKFALRLLEADDYGRGFLQLLEQLTIVDSHNITFEQFKEHLQKISSLVYVIHDTETDKIVGSASVMIEQKFIHCLSPVGHIEDVVVDSGYRKNGFGAILINKLLEVSKNRGCYKVLLDCSEATFPFYGKLGFVKKEVQAVKYF